MDFDPVLDLYPVQDPFLELKTKGKSGQFFLQFDEFVNCSKLQWFYTALSIVFSVCFFGILVIFKRIFHTIEKFLLFCNEFGKKINGFVSRSPNRKCTGAEVLN
jgi:hypothetical protein